ncbi:MAG: YdhR family protein [Candidatus Thermoplasmatota archaeon]|nr:YdhR family protein [Candidatus Thermoplasmatota archaeon]
MPKQLLEISFKFNLPREEYEAAARELATAFAGVPGLQWKVWTLNEQDKEAGGVYLFEDESSMQTFLASDLAAQVKNHPAFSELSAKPYEVLEEPTRTCRGPV